MWSTFFIELFDLFNCSLHMNLSICKRVVYINLFNGLSCFMSCQ